MDWVKRRLLDRVRQFGYHAALMQILRALVRNVYRIDRNIVFVISEFSGSDYHDSCIKPLTGRASRARRRVEPDGRATSNRISR